MKPAPMHLGQSLATHRGIACGVLAAVLLSAGADVRAGHASDQGMSVVYGRVVDAASKRGLPEVAVSLSSVNDATRSGRPVGAFPPTLIDMPASRALTDSDGRFVFANVPNGSYTLTATVSRVGFREGGFIVEGGVGTGAYLNAEYGQRGPNGTGEVIELSNSRRLGEIEVRMWPSASIDGAVTDETGEPIAEVVVGAVRTNAHGDLIGGPTTKTDDRGWFHLGFLAPGDYFVFVPQTLGALPTELAADLADGAVERKSQLRATGIGFSAGQPAIGNPSYVVPVGSAANDVNALQPSSTPGKRLVYPTTFYPGVSDVRSALRVALGAGEHRDGVEVVVRPAEGAKISGQLLKGGHPVPDFGLHLVPGGNDSALSLFEVAYCVTDAKGRFEFPSVPSGQFRLLAFKDPPTSVTPTAVPDAGAWALLDVAVSGKDVEDVVLALSDGLDLRGKIAFSGAPSPEATVRAGSRISMPLAYPRFRRSGLPAATRVGTGGAFEIAGVSPGRYLFTPPQISGWFAASVSLGGREFGDRPFELERSQSDVVVTYARSFVAVMGAVRVSDDVLKAGVTAYLFPADRTLWCDATVMRQSFQSASVSAAGRFQFADVPAGDFLVVATDGREGDRWIDADFLTRIASVASRAHIELGRTTAVSLSTLAGR